MNNSNVNRLMRGALLAFVVLQLVYLFFFFISFPESFRNAVNMEYGALDALASWISTLTMLGYCVVCLGAVAQLVMRKARFLLWFQISGAIALIGNFLVYILRQVDEGYGSVRYGRSTTYYWTLFILALFWTVIWCMYFARSSRMFSYMGENDEYLRVALFTKNVKAPEPWVERSYPGYPFHQPPQSTHPAQPGQPPYQAPARSPYPTPGTAPYVAHSAPPPMSAPPVEQPGYPAPPPPYPAPNPYQPYGQPQPPVPQQAPPSAPAQGPNFPPQP